MFLWPYSRVPKTAFCSCFPFSDLAGESGLRFTATEKSSLTKFFLFYMFFFYCLAVCVSIKIVAVQFLSSLASIIIRLFHNVLPTINKLPLLLPYNTCFEEHSKLRLRHTFGTRKRTLSIIISQKRTLLLNGHYCKLDPISTIANNRRILEERKSASLLRLSAKKTTQNTHKLGQLRRHF